MFKTEIPGVFLLGDIMKNDTHTEKVVSDDEW